MIRNTSFRWKIVYLVVIALLLFPLYMLGRPATGDPATDPEAAPGGTLARLRADYGLSQAELGEIDPASESMKLATLGLRGVAATVLWTKANQYKKTENWEALVATLNQMAKLQPHFISVWEFQSHNLSYNISVEHDDYRFRYLWVKKGIEFLIQGTHYNRKEPRLFWNLGWYTGQKFGRADEHVQFRRLFREDDDFHVLLSNYLDVDGEGRGADSRPDNWLVSRLWYLRAYDLVDREGFSSLRGKSPHIFFADGPKARMNYASTIEAEGYLDERAEYAWRKSAEEWKAFGDRLVPHSSGINIRLNDEEKLRQEAARLREELEKLAPGAREAIRQEKIAQLPPAQRRALELAPEEITDEATATHRWEAEQNTMVTDREVAERAPRARRAQAYRLAKQAMTAERTADLINAYRMNVNFDYWRTRCDIEQLAEAVQARKHVYDAKQLQVSGDLEKAEAKFEQAWELWAKIIKDHPQLLQQLMAEDLFDDVKEYVTLLGQLEKRLPADFPLMHLLEMYGELPDYLEPAAGSRSSGASPPSAAPGPPVKTEKAPADEPSKKDVS